MYAVLRFRKTAVVTVILATCAVAVLANVMASAPIPVSRVVSGRVICIDPGHGGIDPGAVGSSGTLEKVVNLQIAKTLQGHLQALGAIVILTREGDDDLASLLNPAGRRIIDDLELRVEKAKSAGSHMFISIHCNKFPSPVWHGAQTFYVEKGHPDSQRLAETIQAELVRITGRTDRVALGNSRQYVLRQMGVPAVNVEAGFLSNPEEERMLTLPEYQSKIAWAICVGVVRFLAEGLSP